MTTYAIYYQLFTGSADYMSHAYLYVAAKDKQEAQERIEYLRGFMTWTYGSPDGEIMKHKQLRATDPKWEVVRNHTAKL